MSNSHLEDSIPDYETQQLLRKHLMTPFKFTVLVHFLTLFQSMSYIQSADKSRMS